MTIVTALTHSTSYTYDRHVSVGPQSVRLRPAPHCKTPIQSYALQVSPKEHYVNWQQDPFGNYLARFVFPDKIDHLKIEVDLLARIESIDPFNFFLEEHAEDFPFVYDASLEQDLSPYLETGYQGPLFEDFVAAINVNRSRTVDFLVDLNQQIEREVRYLIRMEPGVQTPEETLSKRSGSCRDSAWLLVHVLRHLGIAARFVSGYLIQLKADEVPIDGPMGPEADFTDLHAWTEAFLPGAGWVGLDPTSGLFAGEGHIPLAATPAPQSAAPISGAIGECNVDFSFDMRVTRITETPRVSLPYSEHEWKQIYQAGQKVDERLRQGDVRLTIGGEPTFLAADDRDAPEWTIDATGPTKRDYADKLIRKLRDAFAPGGVLHYGQGKWYPGEPLPRWAFSLYWRRDGSPLWQNGSLIAPESGMAQPATHAEAERFIHGLCDELLIDRDFVTPAYEDAAEYLLRERQLAPNLDPSDNRLEDPVERAGLASVFDRGLNTPASFVLPIQAQQSRHRMAGRTRFRWHSEKWRTRRGFLFLKPGDSPAGFRLPLSSLRYIPDHEYPHVIPRDPFERRRPWQSDGPRFQTMTSDPLNGFANGTSYAPHPAGAPSGAPADWLPIGEEDDWIAYDDIQPGEIFSAGGFAIRTALTIEPRNGRLCVFLPPVQSAEEFVDLINAIEDTAERLQMPVHIEGYPPPPDTRLGLIKVTPDPGVLEVNIHPAANWQEQVEITETLYDAARSLGLDASTYSVDGRRTGSGGGNHMVLGAAVPEDSPFLRRPDLLGSLIRYWQNHPSLSYLFSGIFIGPTSQAPRLDEARDETLYEMEIALNQVPDPFSDSEQTIPPWLTDRLFRNLLVDVTGNTHRAEICIDKLYSPDGPAGRLGLVEFRGFEMPPHPRMSLAQQLLLKALIARFWERPYTEHLIRFGTHLHDRFLLPHFVWQDFLAVLGDLSRHLGTEFHAAWFEPQFEFRFPVLGRLAHEGVELEIRAALEPWPVLGEENVPSGTSRFVDASLDRVQVQVRGELSDRYAVLCNTHKLPLQRTERGDTQVAGIRYRTWLPGYCLHPTIPAHTPLTFDVYDRYNARAVAGCTIYTGHPGGRNSELRPINDREAESRLKSRFVPFGHSPEGTTITPYTPHPDYPLTLDLRRV